MGLAGTANTSNAEAPKGASNPKGCPCQSMHQANKRQKSEINTSDTPAASATRQRSLGATSIEAGTQWYSRRFNHVLSLCIQTTVKDHRIP
jgi:hypothetical protein